MSILLIHPHWALLSGALFGLLMAFGIGANDVSNAMGTSVGSKAISIRTAIWIAAIFEFSGAFLAGGEVTQTIRGALFDPSLYEYQPDSLLLGMLACLLASGFWLLLASIKGWPVSTTHSILGAITGFVCLTIGPSAVNWEVIRRILGSWVVTPVLAGVLAYFVFNSTQWLIFNTENPFKNAKRFGPVYIFAASSVLLYVTLVQGLKHVGILLTRSASASFAVGSAFLLALLSTLYLSKLPEHTVKEGSETTHSPVERIFSVLMLNTACAMAFSHGSNDVANAMGPLAVIVSLIQTQGDVMQTSPIAPWVLPLGGFGIVLGLACLGYKVIATIGTGITHLSPSRGFAAEFATALTVVIASGTGLPVSTTQTLVGAILGVGFARGIAALNLKIVQNIFAGWIITLPVGAGLSVLFFKLLSVLFHATS